MKGKERKGKERNCEISVKKCQIVFLGSFTKYAIADSVYDKYGISPTLIAGMSHGKAIPLILEIK